MLQPDAHSCGPTSTSMIFSYFGKTADLDSLRATMADDPLGGTTTFDNALAMLHAGLSVEAITANPFLFYPDSAEALRDNDMLVDWLRKRKAGDDNDRLIDSFVAFIEEGGSLRIEIPSFSHVRNAIDAGALIFAQLHNAALGSADSVEFLTGSRGFHFVVVDGYDNDMVHVNNPWPDSTQQAWRPADWFIYGVHAASAAYADNGFLLVVSD
jgi:hypothetical protein